ncbi:MAG: hypothetical protein ABGY96_28220 [bacterium]
MTLVKPPTIPKPLPDISGKVVEITDFAIHQKYNTIFLKMIQQLLAFIKEEQSKLTPEENAEQVACSIVSELLDPEIPGSGLLGIELLRYTTAYLLFEESMNRDTIIEIIKQT